MPFDGFPPEGLDFLMAIRFNNNREYFHAHKAEYETLLKRPLIAFCEALTPTVAAIDPLIETRPQKVMSRIYRDTRFTNDKSPYRDHLWVSYHRADREKTEIMGFFFGFSPESWEMGMGMYGQSRPVMETLRAGMRARPSAYEAWLQSAPSFALCGEAYKRIDVPESLPAALVPWYRKKGFWLEQSGEIGEDFCTGDILRRVESGFTELQTLYRGIMDTL